MQTAKASVALVDDHTLLRNGLADLVRNQTDYDVLFEADNGKEFIKELKPAYLPDIVLLDINMPGMDGYETAQWIKDNYPGIKVLALSMYDNEQAVIRMMKYGARGYILKDIEPREFKQALDSVLKKGFYYSDLVTGKLIHIVNNMDDHDDQGDDMRQLVKLTQRELQFLKLVCTEFTYREIAEKMFLSPRTIDGYRDDLFEKLGVKTRVGLVMYAIRNGIVTL
ncbi:MAG TPA: response regulator transcription factor [Chitinophagaceae bacterium]|jgi:DNA-binding NarL/FixJ family response regulator